MRRRDVVAGVIAVLVAAGCVRLGFWQLDRLHQRRARNAELAARLALPPVEISRQALADSVRQRRVVARGVWEYGAEQVWAGRSFEGTPGVALITPLRLADGSVVLVDRGWAPSPDAFHVEHARYREAESAIVNGIALLVPRGRGDVSTTAGATCRSSSSGSSRIRRAVCRGAGRRRRSMTDRTFLTRSSGSVLR